MALYHFRKVKLMMHMCVYQSKAAANTVGKAQTESDLISMPIMICLALAISLKVHPRALHCGKGPVMSALA